MHKRTKNNLLCHEVLVVFGRMSLKHKLTGVPNREWLQPLRKDLTVTGIPFVPLSSQQKAFCFSKIRAANRNLKHWGVYYGYRQCKEFRNLLFSGNRNPNDCIPNRELKQFNRDLDGILEIRSKPEEVLGNRTIEWSLVCGFVQLCRKLARKNFSSDAHNGLELDDYEQEAIVGLVDAIWGYDHEDVAFITYAWCSIKNKLITSNNKMQQLSPFANADLILLENFNVAKSRFNRPVTFDEIVLAMKLSHKDIESLSGMLQRVNCESQVSPNDRSGDENTQDYTAFRKGIDTEEADQADFLCHEQMTVALAQVKECLSDFESELLAASLSPFYGWKSAIASKHINPNTGKQYTKACVNGVLESVRRKLLEVYEAISNNNVLVGALCATTAV